MYIILLGEHVLIRSIVGWFVSILSIVLLGAALVATAPGQMRSRRVPSASPTPTPTPAPGSVAISIAASNRHQVWEGFGASTEQWSDCGNDQIGSSRVPLWRAIYGQSGVGLTMGDLHINPYELTYPNGGCGWNMQSRHNDDGDPNNFNWAGFDFNSSDAMKKDLVDIAEPLGFNNYMIRGGVSTRWQDPWLNDIRSQNYDLYLQEAAENVVAPLRRWRDLYRIVPRFDQPMNEPLTGNNELFGADRQEIVDLVKAVGAKLKAEGLNIKLVVPSEETEEASLADAQAILADPQARQYVGAIAFHTYPYESVYANIGNILNTSGAGKPDAERIAIRNQIRNLAAQYGLEVWMTEVCCGGANFFDTLRGRAIHIHDEMVYTDVSSYWGMYNTGPDSSRSYGEDSISTFGAHTFRITGMGRAIGHYSHVIKQGAMRVDASSGDPLVQVVAFRDDMRGKLALVIINNAAVSKSVSVAVSGVKVSGNFSGEQSTAAAFWRPVTATTQITLPALSVTSLSGNIAAPGPTPIPSHLR
jgi:O-glycosyl hydrolase